MEKITQREIFIFKKVIVYLIEMNFVYNNEYRISKKRKKEILKYRIYLLDFKKILLVLLIKVFIREIWIEESKKKMN